jgi:hypothetical protein
MNQIRAIKVLICGGGPLRPHPEEYTEHWVLYPGYVYPSAANGVTVEIRPGQHAYEGLGDFFARVPSPRARATFRPSAPTARRCPGAPDRGRSHRSRTAVPGTCLAWARRSNQRIHPPFEGFTTAFRLLSRPPAEHALRTGAKCR